MSSGIQKTVPRGTLFVFFIWSSHIFCLKSILTVELRANIRQALIRKSVQQHHLIPHTALSSLWSSFSCRPDWIRGRVSWKSGREPVCFEAGRYWLASFSPPLLMRQSRGVRSLAPLCNVTLLTHLCKAHLTKPTPFLPSQNTISLFLMTATLQFIFSKAGARGMTCCIARWKTARLDRLHADMFLRLSVRTCYSRCPLLRLRVFAARRTRSPSQLSARPPCRFAAPSHRITSAILTFPSIMHKNNWGQARTQA